MCFDADCAAHADAAFAAAVAVPLLAAAAIGAWVLRPPPPELIEKGRVFEDPATGTLFEAPEGVEPELDKDVSSWFLRGGAVVRRPHVTPHQADKQAPN